MRTVTVTCDRCGKTIEGLHFPADPEPGSIGGTSGYYDTSGQTWGQFAKPGEMTVCDACMWADPRYIAAYGHHAVPALAQTQDMAAVSLDDAQPAPPKPRYIIGYDLAFTSHSSYTVLRVIDKKNLLIEASERVSSDASFDDHRQIITDLVTKYQPLLVAMYSNHLGSRLTEQLQDDGLPVHGVSYNFARKAQMQERMLADIKSEKMSFANISVGDLHQKSALVAYESAMGLGSQIDFV